MKQKKCLYCIFPQFLTYKALAPWNYPWYDAAMTTRHILTAMLALSAASLCPALEIAPATEVTPQSELATYTQPLEAMLGIVEKINIQLASVQDENSAEIAGEAIQQLVLELDKQSVAFMSLPTPSPELAEQINAWFTEREGVMNEMVQHIERLENEDPAFFGCQTLIGGIIMIGGALGGAQ